MNLLFDFSVDKANNTIKITREFAADLDLIWDAFTKSEFLDQWMAPKPYRIQTKEMNFREGGRWLYTMVSSDNPNPTRYSMQEFLKIEPKTKFTTRNSFTDENGNHADTGYTFSMNETIFTPGIGVTTVQMVKKMESLAQLEQFIANDYYKEGMRLAMENLDAYLSTLVTSK